MLSPKDTKPEFKSRPKRVLHLAPGTRSVQEWRKIKFRRCTKQKLVWRKFFQLSAVQKYEQRILSILTSSQNKFCPGGNILSNTVYYYKCTIHSFLFWWELFKIQFVRIPIFIFFSWHKLPISKQLKNPKYTNHNEVLKANWVVNVVNLKSISKIN